MEIEQLESSLNKIISEFADETIEKTEKIQDEIAKEAVKELKNTSPKKSGGYAKGWRSKVESKSRTGKVIRIYNATRPYLTHLLEFGHMTRDGKSRTREFPHIAPVEQKVIDKYESRIKNEI